MISAQYTASQIPNNIGMNVCMHLLKVASIQHVEGASNRRRQWIYLFRRSTEVFMRRLESVV